MKKGTPAKGKSKTKSGGTQNAGPSESLPKTPDMSRIKDILLRNPKPLTPIFTPRKAEDRTPKQRLQDLGTPVQVKKIPKPKISMVPSTPIVSEFILESPNIKTADVGTSPFAVQRQITPIPPAVINRPDQQNSSYTSCRSCLLSVLLISLLAISVLYILIMSKNEQ